MLSDILSVISIILISSGIIKLFLVAWAKKEDKNDNI